jgi:hypothetical protein
MSFVEGITGCAFARLTLGNAQAGLGQRSKRHLNSSLEILIAERKLHEYYDAKNDPNNSDIVLHPNDSASRR